MAPLSLFGSHDIDQEVLEAFQTVWARRPDLLRPGQPVWVAQASSGRGLSEPDAPRSLAVLPVFESERLVALLYVEGTILQVKAILESSSAGSDPGRGRSWESYLERTPVEEIEREKLLLLLTRHRWNIARVARLMGVSRCTVYQRLERYHVRRQRVRRTHGHAAGA